MAGAHALTVVQPTVDVIDPHTWTDSLAHLNLRRAVYEPLVVPDGTGGHFGVLAERWSTDDTRAWTFSVRRGPRFHDGAVVDSAAVAAALDRARQPQRRGRLGTDGLFARYLGDAEIRVVDSERLRIVLSRPMADLLDLLCEIPIVAADNGRRVIGTGPHHVVDTSAEQVVTEAAPGYWAGRPHVSRVIWRAIAAPAARYDSWVSGVADIATELAPGPMLGAGAPGRRLVSAPTSHCVVFICNIARGICADLRVRQALNYALDVSAMVGRVGQHGASRLNGPLTPLSLGHDPDAQAYPYDPGRARDLLRSAGIGRGYDLTIDVPTTTPDEALAVAAVMAEQYAHVGLCVRIQVHDSRSEYAEVVRAKKISDLACFDSTPISTYRVLTEKFHSAGGPWSQGYTNPVIDHLLGRAAAAPHLDDRRQLYRRAYRLLRDEAPWVYLYSPTTVAGFGARVMSSRLDTGGVLTVG